MSIAIVDFRSGNLFSVKHALENLGVVAEITSDPDVIRNADAVVLPGVGSFGDAMKNLDEAGLTGALKEYISAGRPFLGICLGLQLLFTSSDEAEGVKGLDLIAGTVKRFDSSTAVKVPHVGWNKLTGRSIDWKETLFKSVSEDDYMYFVHSYYVCPVDENDIVATSDYEGRTFCAAIMKNNIFATQFHPEKSGNAGLKILKEFAALVMNGRKE